MTAKTTLTEPIKVGEEWKNRRRNETVRITLSTFEGVNICDIRQFFTDAEGKMRATKKGVAFNVRLLPTIAAALAKAEHKARELGLIEPGAAQ